MFNVGPFELLIIAIAVLLIFPPKQLPEIARTVGKFLREFRRQTEEVRTTIEREFYQMDLDLSLDSDSSKAKPALSSNTGAGKEADGAQPADHALHEGETPSQPAEHVLHEGETPPQRPEHVFHEGELPPEEPVSVAPSAGTNNGAGMSTHEAPQFGGEGVHPPETAAGESPADARSAPVAKAHQ